MKSIQQKTAKQPRCVFILSLQHSCTGNLPYHLTGILTGILPGNFTGNVTGKSIGKSTGKLTGRLIGK